MYFDKCLNHENKKDKWLKAKKEGKMGLVLTKKKKKRSHFKCRQKIPKTLKSGFYKYKFLGGLEYLDWKCVSVWIVVQDVCNIMQNMLILVHTVNYVAFASAVWTRL